MKIFGRNSLFEPENAPLYACLPVRDLFEASFNEMPPAGLARTQQWKVGPACKLPFDLPVPAGF